jgi:hypothetical protein
MENTEIIDQNVNQEASAEDVKLLQPEVQQEQVPPFDMRGEHPEGEEEDDEESSARRDTELEAAATDEEKNRIREQRRQERRNKQQRQKAKIEKQENELRMLREQVAGMSQTVASLQSSTFQQTMGALDGEIRGASTMADRWTQAEVAALAKNDATAAAHARREADAWRERGRQMEVIKHNANSQAQQQATRPQPLDPRMVSKAQAFAAKHNWYSGPQSNDPDSKVLTALDHGLTSEGWDPTTEGYWEELEARVGKYLPHRKGRNDGGSSSGNRNGAQRQPVSGSTSGAGAGTPPKGGFQVSAERVKAMKEAGIWDDPKRRDAAIKRYQEYDAANKA